MIGQRSKSSKETQRGKKNPLCTAREDPKFHLCQLYFPKPRFKTVRTVQFQIHTHSMNQPADAAAVLCRLINDEQSSGLCVFFWLTAAKWNTPAEFITFYTPLTTSQPCNVSCLLVCVGGVCKCPVFVSWLQHRTTTLGWILLQSKPPSKRKATEVRQTKEDKVIGKEWRGKINGEKSSHFTVKANPEDISELGARK